MKRFTISLSVLSVLVLAGLMLIFMGWGGQSALEAAPGPTSTELSGVIVFQGGGGPPYEIYLLDLTTSQMVNLTDDPANDFFPSVSPDGSQILFASNRGEGGETAFDVYVMDTDGANVVNLTQDGLSDEGVWSPDGRQIAVRKNLTELWIMDADGSNPTQVPLPEDEVVGGVLSWSAAGDRIAYNCTVGEADDLEVCAVNTDGSDWANLTDNPGYDFGAVWSPGGDKIAFMSQRDGDNEIYVMDADGSNALNLTDNPAADGAISWSPDGSQIFFASDRDEGVGIYVMDADGSNPTRLADAYPITVLARPTCLIPQMTELPPAPTAVPPSELPAEAAPATGEGPEDIPLMADAQISIAQESLVVYHTDSSISDAASFYQSRMPELGWSQMEGVGMITEDMTMMQFEKEGRIAQVLAMPDQEKGEGTMVSISLQ